MISRVCPTKTKQKYSNY